MRALAPLLLLATACAPTVEVSRFSVTVATVERCVLRSGGEVCEEPEPIQNLIQVVVETVESSSVTLYASDHETGTDRAYVGQRQGAQLVLSREESRTDEETGCSFLQRADLSITIEETTIQGSERLISDESEACSELGIATFEREERVWRGERQEG